MSMDFVAESFEASDWQSEAAIDAQDPRLIRNVLLSGTASKNGYGLTRAYSSEARVKELYEGKNVCIDHKYESHNGRMVPVRNRSLLDVAGVIRNVRLRGGKPYADVHAAEEFPKSDVLLGFVKQKNKDVGFSHVAAYDWGTEGGKRVVNGIKEIATVDAVMYPATTNTFFEHDHSGGDHTMSIELLTQQLKEQRESYEKQLGDLRTSESALRTERDALKTERDSLKGDVTKLTSERDGALAKVLQFETAEKLSKQMGLVKESCKKAGLNVESSVECPEKMLDIAAGFESEADRSKYINDWAAMVKDAKQSNTRRSTERKESGGDEDEWDLEAEFKKDGYEVAK